MAWKYNGIPQKVSQTYSMIVMQVRHGGPLLPLQHVKKDHPKYPMIHQTIMKLDGLEKNYIFGIQYNKDLLHSHFSETKERGRPFCHSHSLHVSRGKGDENKKRADLATT